ncbi:MAG: MBL fold metallo-hydrolase, partial [Deltaproteobacteria bacterium]
NIDLYDHLLAFLEDKIPFLGKEDAKKKQKRDLFFTTINFLMELSALASGEASYGYAERARALLKPHFSDHNKTERGFYDRWIGYNRGMARQHMIKRSREAVLEFNWIIEEFVAKHVEDGGGFDEHKHGLEFLLNICPGTVQRAAINLKMQLSYHALQTLVEKHMDWLTELENSECGLFNLAAHQLRSRINLYRLEALLQLGDMKQAEHELAQLYKELFDGILWSKIGWVLPSSSQGDSSALKTQLVEHTVTWWFEEMQDLYKGLSGTEWDKVKAEDFDQAVMVLDAIKENYWEWIKDNGWFDKRVYFSKWALFLGTTAKTLINFLDFSNKNPEEAKHVFPKIERVLNAAVALYLAQRRSIPVVTNLRETKKMAFGDTIQIENLRSDDLPDFLGGLSSFYETMSKVIKPTNKLLSIKNLKRAFRSNKSNLDPAATLRDDHLRLLDAVDEWEEQFWQRRRISRLNRCNERLIWFDNSWPDSCESCLDSHSKSGKELPSSWSFKGLLPCAKDAVSPKNKPMFADEHLRDYDYQHIMELTENDLTKHLKDRSRHLPQWKALHFVGLQRWNSETPAQGRSVGGGYFIYRTDKKGLIDLGIAIDPGFDFIRNFFRMGFSLKDINIVLISHAHPDHLWDFESMIHLLHELEEKKHDRHRIHTVLTLSGYKRLEHVITNSKLKRYVNPLIIDIRKEIEKDYFENLGLTGDAGGNGQAAKNCFRFLKSDDANCQEWELSLPLSSSQNSERGVGCFDTIDIFPTRAYHDDHTEISDSFGFIVNFQSLNEDNMPFSFGYTGDSKWVGDDLYNSRCPVNEACQPLNRCHWGSIDKQYTECDALLIHLGSLIDHKKAVGNRFDDYTKKSARCDKLIRGKNHLYLMGIIRFLRNLNSLSKKDTLILIGEFGEEMRGGIRTDLVERLEESITQETHKWSVLPVDVGLDVCLQDLNTDHKKDGHHFRFRCTLCDRYIPVTKIKYHRFGQDEGIFYVCSTCLKATPDDVRSVKLRRIYEIGREMKV